MELLIRSATMLKIFCVSKRRIFWEDPFLGLTDPESVIQFKGLIDASKNASGKPLYFQDFGLYCTQCFRHYFDGMILQLDSDNERRYAIYLHDVTTRKLEAEKLAKINLELDSFIYKASHDLRSPLLSISGLINLTEKIVHEENRDYIHLMRRSVDRLDKFITQLAHYTRNNNMSVDYTNVNFRDLFSEVIESYRFLPNSEKIQFQLVIENEEESYSDTFRLRIILNSLVSNAIKYPDLTKRFPSVRVIFNSDRKRIRIKVADNGFGIEKEGLSKIFDMFKRATNKADGSGLGLYIVKKALEKLHGTIEVESEAGQGSTFSIDVPNKIDYCKEEPK